MYESSEKRKHDRDFVSQTQCAVQTSILSGYSWWLELLTFNLGHLLTLTDIIFSHLFELPILGLSGKFLIEEVTFADILKNSEVTV